MMKKLKATLAVLLAAASVLSLSGCAEDVAPTGGSTGGDSIAAAGSSAPATSATTTTFAENEGVNDAVHNMDVTTLDNPDLEVTERIEWMATTGWVIDETTPAAILFKEVYGIPTTGKYESCDGKIFDFTEVSYEERFDALGKAIAADQSPDLFPFYIDDFPSGVARGRYNPVDDIIDLDGPKWDIYRDWIEQFAVGDDHYCAIWYANLRDLMYYKKSNIESINAEDPRELFERGEWTWDKFLEIARAWQDSGDGKYALDGWNGPDLFTVTTGVPMVGWDGAHLVNNLNNSAVERVEEFMATIQKENLRYPVHENGWSINPKLWATDYTLFYCNGGTWVFEGNSGLQAYAEKLGWSDDEIVIVPVPKDPQADKHYAYAKQDSLMWVKGSDNANGVAAWLDCNATVSQDPEVNTAGREQQKENYGWSDYNLDAYYEWSDITKTPLTLIFDYKTGVGLDSANAEDPIAALTSNVWWAGEQTFTQIRAENEGAINAAIAEMNDFLDAM